MRLAILLTFFISTVFSLSAQISPNERLKTSKKIQHLEINERQLTKDGFLLSYFKELGLTAPDDLQEVKTINDLAGWQRIKYGQKYQGLNVLGSKYTLHQKEGTIKRATGVLLPYIDVSTDAQLSAAKAEDIAIKFCDNYIFEHAEILDNDNWEVSIPELVIMDQKYPNLSGVYKLAYKVVVSEETAFNQPFKEAIYINANDGSILTHLPLIAHTNVEGLAKTKLYGEQVITVDSVSPTLFTLNDYTRGYGVITKNGSGQDFTDEDNYWDNFNDQKEEVGTDAHYCGAAYYDFMKDNFNWIGVDGDSMAVVSWVFGGERNYVNAYWNGQRAVFGSGDCDQYHPLTTLTVVAHEFAHGFTGNTSELIYRNESGALNESISDIFGKAVEYEYDYDNFSWLIGDKFLINPEEDQPFRSMSDPNFRNDPKYYGGEDWYVGAGDAGGVHSNSGVFNYWFYLLVEGVSDTTETDYIFDVEAIGMDKAIQIVFSLNTGYLTEGSGYLNCMYNSLLVCDDLFGPNSSEKASVIEAWKAVGIEIQAADQDLNISMIDDDFYMCKGDNSLYVEIDIDNAGIEPYVAGTVIEVFYTLDEMEKAREQITLTEDLLPGDSIHYQFMHVEELPDEERGYNLVVTIQNDEYNALNNSFEADVDKIGVEGLDLELSILTIEKRFPCDPDAAIRLRTVIRNRGCVPLPEGIIPGVLTINGEEMQIELDLGFDLNVNSSAGLIDQLELEQELTEITSASLRLFLAGDPNADNDYIEEGNVIAFASIKDGYLQEFNTDYDPFTDLQVKVDPDPFSIAQLVPFNGEPMIGFSGEDTNPFNIEECTNEETFIRENYQITEMEFCVDAIGMLEPVLAFDLVQFHADAIEDSVLPAEYGAMVKMFINDLELPVIFGQTEGEIVHHEFNLPIDYQDLIRIEVLTLTGNDGAFIGDDFSVYDFVLMDNLTLFDNVVSTSDFIPNNFKVFPNPGSSVFTFKNTVQDLDFDVTIFDSLGKTLAQIKGQNGASTWDASNLDSGIYFYTIEEENGALKNGKLVLQK